MVSRYPSSEGILLVTVRIKAQTWTDPFVETISCCTFFFELSQKVFEVGVFQSCRSNSKSTQCGHFERKHYLAGGAITILKNISQWEGLSHI